MLYPFPTCNQRDYKKYYKDEKQYFGDARRSCSNSTETEDGRDNS
jgi:hypothetical protein